VRHLLGLVLGSVSKFVNQSSKVSDHRPKLKIALRLPVKEALRQCCQRIFVPKYLISDVFTYEGKARNLQGELNCEQSAARTPWHDAYGENLCEEISGGCS
jgi:hypothetical protein